MLKVENVEVLGGILKYGNSEFVVEIKFKVIYFLVFGDLVIVNKNGVLIYLC